MLEVSSETRLHEETPNQGCGDELAVLWNSFVAWYLDIVWSLKIGFGISLEIIQQLTTAMPIYLGTSGWSYKDWVGNTYPEGTPAAGYLHAYAELFPTVEIDSTFYGIPRANSVAKWDEDTPDGFVFAAKVPQIITHEKVLMDCRDEMNAFLDRMSALEVKLGPLLFQFPYGFKYESFDLLAAFLETLPAGFRFAVEVRHKSWLKPRFYDMLRERNVALALIDHPWMPKLDEVTADFAYIRWLGDRKAVTEPFNRLLIDRSADLRLWKEILDRISAEDRMVFGYFNNHYEGHSPSSLENFAKMMSGKR